MSADSLADRLQRPLVWVVGAVFTLGSISAFVVDPTSPSWEISRPGPGTAGNPAPEDGSPAAPDDDGAAQVPVPPVSPDDPAAPNPEPAPLGASVVPAAGVYRYEVQTTDERGTSTVQEERREIEVVSGDRTAGTVRISARLDGESQVSVLDWTPTGAVVRSTRIESPSGVGQDCAWEPPFTELGALGAGAAWQLDSTCRTPVGGVDTVFTITGQGQVVGEATVAFKGTDVRVWQIRRDRTTTIEAEFGGRTLRQTAREEGTLSFDPSRGLVLRSDVTVTLAGTQTGVTRRVSVLQPG